MADIALEQLLHTAGDNTLSQTDGALHGYMRGTDGTATRTVKTDANGNITISPDSGLGTEATLAELETLLASLDGKAATEAKLEAVRTLVALAQTNTSDIFQAVKTRDWGKEATLAAAKNVLDTISAAVAARATEATLAAIKDALTDGTQKVQLSGSKEALRWITANQSATIAAGGSETITIEAAAGTIAEVHGIVLRALAPVGATTGTHAMELGVGTLGNGSYGSAAYGASLLHQYGHWYVASQKYPPDTPSAVAMTMSGALQFSKAVPLQIKYSNSTDVAQTQARVIQLLVVERGVVV